MKRAPAGVDLFEFAGNHLFYEAQMFVYAFAIQLSNPFYVFDADGLRQFEANVRVEVIGLHMRNLIEFFYPGIARRDDVLAVHYVAHWDTKRPTITPLLDKARGRANKELHHLTSQRISGTPDHKTWDFMPIREDLKNVVTIFISCQPNMPPKTIAQLLEI